MGFAPGPGTGGGSSIAGASDVALNSPETNQTLIYSAGSSKWQNADAIGPVQIAGVLDPGDAVPNDGRYYLQLDSAATGNPTVAYIGSYTSSSDSTSGAITLTQNVEIGAVLVVTLHGGGSGTTMTASAPGGNSWSYGSTSSTSVETPHSTTRIAYARVTGALTSGQTITVSRGSNGSLVAHLAVIRSVNGTAGNDGIGEGSTSTVNFSSFSAQARSVVVSAATTTANVNFTSAGGGAILTSQASSSGGTQPRSGAMLHQVSTSAGTVSHTVGLSTGMQHAHVSLEIR